MKNHDTNRGTTKGATMNINLNTKKVSSPSAANTILLGPSSGLRDVFSKQGKPKPTPEASSKTPGVSSLNTTQSKLRQGSNSVKPSRPPQQRGNTHNNTQQVN